MHNNSETLKKLAFSLSKFIDDNEKISLPALSLKLGSAKQSFPEDHTIGIMENIVNKMIGSNKASITRAELRDLYEKLYTRNTKFASVFGEELGELPQLAEPVKYDHSHEGNELNLNNIYEQVIDDAEFTGSMRQAMGDPSAKIYSTKVANKSVELCKFICNKVAIANDIKIINGQKDLILCLASFETPKGPTSIYIPVEVNNEQVFLPTNFVGNNGLEDLTAENLTKYLTTKAGEKLTLASSEVYNSAAQARKFGQSLTNIDLLVNKLESSQEDQITNLVNDIVDAPIPKDPEIERIATAFDTEYGFASFKFGNKTVDDGKITISRSLKNFGFPVHNIAVAASDEDGITYSVALNGGSIAFQIPVKIEAGCMLPPSVLLCNGTIKSFNKTDITSLAQENEFDVRAAVIASPLYGLKAGELVNTVRIAMAEGNYAKAEDALNILSTLDDEKAYAIALGVFTTGLNNKQSNSQPEISKCSHVVKSKHSQYELCGHTGLPVHKVYQDSHGNCLPKYRQEMSDSYDGATFMSSKVLLG